MGRQATLVGLSARDGPGRAGLRRKLSGSFHYAPLPCEWRVGLSTRLPVSTSFPLVTPITRRAETGGRGGECLLSARLASLSLKASLRGARSPALESTVRGRACRCGVGMSQADVRAEPLPPRTVRMDDLQAPRKI